MVQKKYYFIYLLTNKNNTVIYTGVTNDLLRRIAEHKAKSIPGFTQKYNIDKLVYFESFESVELAIAREKQIKAGSRMKKIELIDSMNPGWEDLYPGLMD
jgi:putative endonuclease